MTLQLQDIKNLLEQALLKQKDEIVGEINNKIDLISKDLLQTKADVDLAITMTKQSSTFGNKIRVRHTEGDPGGDHCGIG